MRAWLLAALVLQSGPVTAQGLIGTALCQAVWNRVAEGVSNIVPISGTVLSGEGGTCEIADVVLDLPGDHSLDWRAERVWLSGRALQWLIGEEVLPDRLDLKVEGLHYVLTTGMPQMDYLYAAQARAQPIRGELALAWDAVTRRLTIERLEVDFPGDNLLQLSAVIDRVDLSSEGAIQMSATALALREADLDVRSHGLFEWYVLMPFGSTFLPSEGDMAAAMADLKGEAVAAVRALPGTSFPEGSKAALAALIDEMPNPAGTLSIAVDAGEGFGPSRFLGYAATGVPDSLDGLAVLLDGVTVKIGWTHEETR